MKKRAKLTPEEIDCEEQRTSAIGLCLQAESFLKTAEFTWKKSKSSELSIRFDSPLMFLLSHGIELTLKAWLRANDYDLKKLRFFGHNLTSLYKECKRKGLPLDERSFVAQWAAQSPALYFDASDSLISESQRVASFSETRQGREVWRHIWLLGKLHNAPYTLRYHRSGYYTYPDFPFLLMYAFAVNNAANPFCMAHYNDSKLAK